MGVLMVGDDYELVGFDVVSDPSTFSAWFCKPGEDIPPEYLTNNGKKEQGSLFEKLNRFNDWLNE